MSDARAAGGRALVVATVIAWLAYVLQWLAEQFIVDAPHSARGRVEAVAYLVTVSLLTASALAYLVCRLGFFYRSREHRRMPRAELEHFFGRRTPTVTVLIPSYKEDLRTIRQTVLSAALQDYPALRVVLLVDDPPSPARRSDQQLLEQARRVAPDLQELLDGPQSRFTIALELFAATGPDGAVELGDMAALAGEYDAASTWLSEQAAATEHVDHIDDFFVDQVLHRLARDFTTTADALRGAVVEGVVLPRPRLLELHQRLAWTFQADLTSFERKQYVSLSHESNKAMNLNSYLGLMGGSYRDTVTVSGRELVPYRPGSGDLEVPDPDYVLTLDADSVLLPEYCLRLVHLMEQSEHARVAVGQTPYSAYPGSGTRLERIAGATTDLQFIAHQGMTYYDATFWVGANAVLRKRALDEIRSSTYVGRWEIRRYIQDRTVIEDTESTVDMRAAGWSLLNYPERLAYSATPPDFGSLCIQRRRWANGGVLILPKLWRARGERTRRGELNSIAESFIRLNYMGSVAWSSLSLLLLLAYPFDRQLISPLLGLIALPYFVGMASDLKYCGYKRTDVLRIYGFNLILIPVQLAGFANSLVQALTGEKGVFGRTPKVRDRTVPNFLFVVSPYLLVALAGWTLWQDWQHGRWVNFTYATVNTTLALYAVVAYIGVRHSIGDLCLYARRLLSVPVTKPAGPGVPDPAPVAVASNVSPDWASVLHFGTAGAAPLPVVVEALASVPRQRRSAGQRSTAPTASDNASFRTVFQPIVEMATGHIIGREALSRFDDGIAPHQRLAEEAARGRGLELEILLTRASVQAAADLPAGEWLGVNASIALVRAGRALPAILERAQRPLVLELDAAVLAECSDVVQLLAEVPQGATVAITAVRPGYDCLRLVGDLRPSFVKLDRSWVRGICGDPARQALVRALIDVTNELGAGMIAEGVETDEERLALQQVGVRYGQGYLLGRPRANVPTWAKQGP